jgi:GTP 3',8-cyclase
LCIAPDPNDQVRHCDELDVRLRVELERSNVKNSPLTDSFGRQINYLRISLTELCNFRCVYCVPSEGLKSLPPDKALLRSEIVRLVKIMGTMGVTRIRLTGGEPLLRSDLPDIVRALKAVDSVRDLSITTNGSRLAPMLDPLKEAGLDRINISLDSSNAKRFQEVTGVDEFQKVMNATFLALSAGFPVKLNMVAVKGLAREEIIKFVTLAREYPFEVRFLEFMPLCGSGWGPERFVPISLIRSIVQEHFDLIPESLRGDQVAQTFQLKDGKGKVGFIASLTESFCDNCSRMRLSSDGKLFPCLFSNTQVSVKELLKENAPDDQIEEAIREAARIKPKGNWFREKPYKVEEGTEFQFEPSPLIHNIGG